MQNVYQQQRVDRIVGRLQRLYPDHNLNILSTRLRALIGRYEMKPAASALDTPRWSGRNAVLITYGDSVTQPGEYPLETLKRFIQSYLHPALSTVHILPFFPYSSDDGFSVIHYRKVREDLGDWQDVQAISESTDLMIDLVINHVSRKSEWFKYYMLDTAPYRDFFIETAPETDLSQVVRPRDLPLLSPVTREGQRKHLWTTFSRDQLDVNFANPDVLFEYLDIFLYYLCQRARMIRLDAIAYLWKTIGTSCIHLPETHEVVKLLRDLTDLVAPRVILITETNVPHAENVSYFGDGDEAHMVYQFSLPPLILHALHNGTAEALTRWAMQLEAPPHGCTFLNFTASHDGIGVRPFEGLVPPAEVDALIEAVRARGGQVSVKRNADGTTSPYELNITYFSALGPPEDAPADPLHMDRFICSQTIPCSLAGIPAFYIHSLTACPNDQEGVKKTGRARSINRKQWDWTEITGQLADPASPSARVLARITNVLTLRAACPAFSPDASQSILTGNPACFAVERTTDEGAKVIALHNVSAWSISGKLNLPFTGRDLLSDEPFDQAIDISLAPYQCRWLADPACLKAMNGD